MSEKILRALMQLFAIIAKIDLIEEEENTTNEGKQPSIKINFREDSAVVESFLRSELNSIHVVKYLELFTEYIQIHHGVKKIKDGFKKRTSVNSVKVLRICSQINEELTQRQKFIVLIRLFEFINSSGHKSEQEIIFVATVSEMFNVSSGEYALLEKFLESTVEEDIDNENILYISNTKKELKKAKQFSLDGLNSEIRVFKINSISTFFYRYFGTEELIMNGQIVSNRTQILNQGSTLKTQKSQPIYYSDIISNYLNKNEKDKITFKVSELEYIFKSGKTAIQPVNFIEESGKLVGIMGGSGTGKSTFLNILNGNLKPSKGKVSINGIDVHFEKDKLDGVIGFISQDDLLIEELTVYQNLYFNTKLCFDKLSERAIQKKVIEMLTSLGLLEAKDLIVGNPLEQTISGGQRKRVNIALELIREPSVLFVDEPTSGLSSRDSENIIDLLKELSSKGKLIFIVIHQPSSEIFKMFDRLLLLDNGGYPIFDGNPVDAVVYFKTHIHHVDAYERECYSCGNVNPEQIFNIIESKVVDEYGNLTGNRKTSPKEWNELFLNNPTSHQIKEQTFSLESNNSKRPSKWVQFKVFFARDFLSKISNRQYMLINLLEAPVLALLLSFFVKYYNNFKHGYSFFENVNIPQYIFIAVIVALFIGLTVSAEEIFKDRKILKRESFLNLSKRSYLISKISILFILSAIQSLLFVVVGNYILEINGLFLEYWAVLFSISCLANIFGLNISSAFNSVKVIYIIVPLIIIPQLLFSGVIVKFDKLNPVISKNNDVPWIGNSMAARWAYEALAVSQAKDNEYEKTFFLLNQEKSNASWKKDYWIPEMKKNRLNLSNPSSTEFERKNSQLLLLNEIKKEEGNWSNLKCVSCIEELSKNTTSIFNDDLIKDIDVFLEILNNQYIKNYKIKTSEIEYVISEIGEKKYKQLKNKFGNESLKDLVTNRREFDKLLIIDNEIIQKDKPIYNEPKNERFLDAHFYSPSKNVFGIKISTFWSNLGVIWFMSIFFSIALYYDWLKKVLKNTNYFINKFTDKENMSE